MNYPSQKNSHAFTYTLDPCVSATVIVPDPQSDPPDHAYRGPTSFQASYTASDTSCAVEYTCVPPASGTTDLCALGSLNSRGVFELDVTDTIAYPPGTYQVEILGFISGYSSRTNSHTFDYELVHPCSIASISLSDQVTTESLDEEYTYSGPIVIATALEVSDQTCEIEITCVAPASGIDLCSYITVEDSSGETTSFTFDISD